MRLRAITTVMGLGLCLGLTMQACSEKAGSPAPSTEAAPTLPSGREGAYLAAEADPETFVRALYAAYDAKEPRPEPGRDPVYTRTLNALVGEDFRRSNGRPWLKVDPVCDCTKGSVILTQVEVQQSDRTNATANVRFTVDSVQKSQTLTLMREATRWRVADVQAAGKPLLSESLFKAIG